MACPGVQPGWESPGMHRPSCLGAPSEHPPAPMWLVPVHPSDLHFNETSPQTHYGLSRPLFWLLTAPSSLASYFSDGTFPMSLAHHFSSTQP